MAPDSSGFAEVDVNQVWTGTEFLVEDSWQRDTRSTGERPATNGVWSSCLMTGHAKSAAAEGFRGCVV